MLLVLQDLKDPPVLMQIQQALPDLMEPQALQEPLALKVLLALLAPKDLRVLMQIQQALQVLLDLLVPLELLELQELLALRVKHLLLALKE